MYLSSPPRSSPVPTIRQLTLLMEAETMLSVTELGTGCSGVHSRDSYPSLQRSEEAITVGGETL